jgi:hypothetical protein
MLDLGGPVVPAGLERADALGATPGKGNDDERAGRGKVIDDAVGQGQRLLGRVIDPLVPEPAACQGGERPYVPGETAVRMRGPLLAVFRDPVPEAVGALVRLPYLPEVRVRPF